MYEATNDDKDQDDNDQGYPNAHADWSLTFHRRNDIDVLTAVRNHAGASRTGSSGVCVLVCNGLNIDLTLPRSKTPIHLAADSPAAAELHSSG